MPAAAGSIDLGSASSSSPLDAASAAGACLLATAFLGMAAGGSCLDEGFGLGGIDLGTGTGGGGREGAGAGRFGWVPKAAGTS